MIYYRSKLYNIMLKSSTSFKMWEIYHLFNIILAIKKFPFINHVFDFFFKIVIETLLNEKN